MTPDEFPCSSAEDRDFLEAAALLSAGAIGLAFFGMDLALFLNSLFINF
ncbi:hypothetical protein LJR084_001870 [Variovorax sp. LjRoot84]